MRIWPFGPKTGRRRRRTEGEREWLQFSLLRLEERRVLSVNATLGGVGDLLDVQLTGPNETATLTVNNADEIELRDSAGDIVLIDGNPTIASGAIQTLQVMGDGSGGQHVLLESNSPQPLALSAASFTGIDDLTFQLEVAADSINIDIQQDFVVGSQGRLTVDQLEATSGDVAIATGGLLSSPQIHLQPQVGLDLGIGQGSFGAWQLDTNELTAGIESDGLVRLGRIGGAEAVNIRGADLSGEGYDLEVHGGAITLGGDAAPAAPLFADNSAAAAGIVDGVYTNGGFNSIVRARCFFGDTDFDVGDGSGDTATWSFDGLEDGEYQVAVTWCSVGSRATNAPFTISGTGFGATNLLVDQSGQPDDFLEDGVAWETLLTVNISGGMGAGTLEVALGDDANGYVVADGVRLSRAEPTSPQGPDLDVGDRVARLIASAGITDVVDSNTESLDIVAGAVSFEAALGIGVGGNGALETNVNTLAASAGGGVFISEQDSVTIGSVATTGIQAAGRIELRANGQLHVDAAIQNSGGDGALLDAAGDIVLSSSISTNGGALELNAEFGEIRGSGGLGNPSGSIVMNAQAIGESAPISVTANTITAAASVGSIQLHSPTMLLLTTGVTAPGDIHLSSLNEIRVDGTIESEAGAVQLESELATRVLAPIFAHDISVFSGQDVQLDDTLQTAVGDILLDAARDLDIRSALNSAGAATIRAGRDIRFEHGVMAEGDIEVAAGTIASGGVEMANTSTIHSVAGQVSMDADSDIRLSRVSSGSNDPEAVRLESRSGAITDADDLLPAIEASGVVLRSAGGVHRDGDPLQPFLLATDFLSVYQLGAGRSFVEDPDTLAIHVVDAGASGGVEVQAQGDLVLVGQVDSLSAPVHLASNAGSVEFRGAADMQAGDLRVRAEAGIVLTETAVVRSTSGNIEFAADESDTSFDGLRMDDGSRIETENGLMELSGNGDVWISSLVSNPTTPGDSIRVTSRSGDLLDAGDSDPEFQMAFGVAQLQASGGIGVGNALETQFAELAASAGAGGIQIDDRGSFLASSLSTVGDVAVTAAEDLHAEEVTARDVWLQTLNGRLELLGSVTVHGDLQLDAGSQLRQRAASHVMVSGNAQLTANAIGVGAGILMEDASTLTANGLVRVLSGDNVVVSRIESLAPQSDAVRMEAGGAILDGGDSAPEVVAVGAEFIAGEAVGQVDALETSLSTISASTTGIGADIRINNTSPDTSIERLMATGDILVETSGNLSLDGPIETGFGAEVSMRAHGSLLAHSRVSTALSGAGDGDLLLRGVTLTPTFQLFQGPGDISLWGENRDTLIQTSLDLQGDTQILSHGDILVTADITGAAGAEITLHADVDAGTINNEAGGVWLTSSGSLRSQGQVTLRGSDILSTTGLDGVRISSGAGVQLSSLQSLVEAETTAALEGAVEGPIRVVAERIEIGNAASLTNGEIQLEATGDIIMAPDATLDAGASPIGMHAGGDLEVGRVRSTSSLGSAITATAGGAIRDINGAAVNFLSLGGTAEPSGGLSLAANQIGAPDEPLEALAGSLTSSSMTGTWLHSQGDLLLGANQAPQFELTSTGSLLVFPPGIDAAELHLTTDAQLTINGPLSGEAMQLQADEVRVNDRVLATGPVTVIANSAVVDAELQAQSVLLQAGQLVLEGDIAAEQQFTINAGQLATTATSTTQAETLVWTSDDNMLLQGDVQVTETASLHSQDSMILEGRLQGNEVEIASTNVVAIGGSIQATSRFESASDGGFLMSVPGTIDAGVAHISAGDVVISRIVATASLDDAIQIQSRGAINDLGSAIALEAAGVELQAATGIGNDDELTLDVDRLRLVNQSGDVSIVDATQLEVLSAEQRGADGELMELIALGPLIVQGVASTESGQLSLVSEFDRVDVLADAFGSERLVVTADDDVTLGPNARLLSDTGNIGVLADFSQSATGGRLVMADSSLIRSNSGLVAARASGDLIISSVESGRSGSAIRLESTMGDIIKGGVGVNIAAPQGGLQLVAAGDVGAGDSLEIDVARLAAATGGQLHVVTTDALSLDDVGSMTGIDAGGDVTIMADVLTNESTVVVDGELTLRGHSRLRSMGSIHVSDGSMSLVSDGAIELLENNNNNAEVASSGDGIIRVDAGESLLIAPGVVFQTSTGLFQDLPLSPGENVAMDFVSPPGVSPVGADGVTRVAVSVGQPGDLNYHLDVAWSDGVNEQVLGVAGGSSELAHRFAGMPNRFSVTIRFGLDPRTDAQGGVVEHVQLFVEGEPLRPELTQTRELFGLGVDNVVLTFESEVEPIVERARVSEPPLLLQTTNRETIVDSLPVGRNQVESHATVEDRIVLLVIDDLQSDPRLRETDELALEFSDLDDLKRIPKKYGLPDGHYRIYFQEAGSARRRLLFDIHVVGGKVVPANYREGATERPPQQPETEQGAEQQEAGANELESGRGDRPASPPVTAPLGAMGLLGLAKRRVRRPLAQSKAARLARRVMRHAAKPSPRSHEQ